MTDPILWSDLTADERAHLTHHWGELTGLDPIAEWAGMHPRHQREIRWIYAHRIDNPEPVDPAATEAFRAIVDENR